MRNTSGFNYKNIKLVQFKDGRYGLRLTKYFFFHFFLEMDNHSTYWYWCSPSDLKDTFKTEEASTALEFFKGYKNSYIQMKKLQTKEKNKHKVDKVIDMNIVASSIDGEENG